jgi:hypothetical protein
MAVNRHMITILKRTIEEHGIEAGLLGIGFARWEADKVWDKPSDDALSIVSIVMEISEVLNVAVRSAQAAKRPYDNYQTNGARLETVRFKINLISETLKELQKYFDAQRYQRSSVMEYRGAQTAFILFSTFLDLRPVSAANELQTSINGRLEIRISKSKTPV